MNSAPSIEQTVTDHLVARGLVEAGHVAIRPMTGGVSADVFGVGLPSGEIVVKRALPRLRVAEKWIADPARIETEARALELAERCIPGRVPHVIDITDGFLVMQHAPRTWRNWKSEMLEGRIDCRLARALGETLSSLHAQTTEPDVASAFGDQTGFIQLRVDPFFRAVAVQHPDLSDAIDATIQAMETNRACLVHGDFTPKNILIGQGEEHWVLDWEVAHFGDPAFDPALLLTHLLLKCVRSSVDAPALAAAARAFLAGYAERGAMRALEEDNHVVALLGCLLLARIDGRSPVEYLDRSRRERVRELGRGLLCGSAPSVPGVFEEVS